MNEQALANRMKLVVEARRRADRKSRRKEQIAISVTAAILITIATWLAWDYLFGATDHGYVGDELEFAIDLDESTVDLYDPPRVLIFHDADPSWERIIVMMPGEDGEETGASVDISLEAGTHPGPQWYCTSNAPINQGEIGPAWSPLTTNQRHEMRTFDRDEHEPPYGITYPPPAVMCQRQGDMTAIYGQGHVSLAPAHVTHTHNAHAEIEFTGRTTVNAPATWARELPNEHYAFTEEGVIGTSGFFEPTEGITRDPEVEWIETLPLFFVDAEREARAERNAWISALIGGLGFGLLPSVLLRFH